MTNWPNSLPPLLPPKTVILAWNAQHFYVSMWASGGGGQKNLNMVDVEEVEKYKEHRKNNVEGLGRKILWKSDDNDSRFRLTLSLISRKILPNSLEKFYVVGAQC
ncbi:unnamed protein product [Cercopithifilaria johnstoni]|uniref:Uncharacterized protein n=1 Tax=Cercopithifilaria johnstoni TaxID=2874296 RepID=A0A8J2LPX9_9BILA|nr:unnamed protein product [Cercopithifilaria johnstoni]